MRVWDSSAEQRYIVIPERPEGTEKMTEEQLADLVTRDSMIGVGLVKRAHEKLDARRVAGGHAARKRRDLQRAVGSAGIRDGGAP